MEFGQLIKTVWTTNMLRITEDPRQDGQQTSHNYESSHAQPYLEAVAHSRPKWSDFFVVGTEKPGPMIGSPDPASRSDQRLRATHSSPLRAETPIARVEGQ